MKALIPLLLLTLIAAAAGGGAVYVLGPERVVLPENVIIWRQGYVPLWIDNELTWVEENRVFVIDNWDNIPKIVIVADNWENVRPGVIFSDNVFKVEIYRWPPIVVENISYEVCYAIKPVGPWGGCQQIDNLWICWF